MKMCWDNLNRIKYTKRGEFRTERRTLLVYVESCLLCGEPFFADAQDIKKGRGKYCSNMCSRRRPGHPLNTPKGKGHPNHGRKRPDVQKRQLGSGNCMYGKNGKDHPMYGKRGKLNHMYGKLNHNWKGGVTPLHEKLRRTAEYKEWRLSVFERDNYTCQKCNKRGGDMHAHHIKSFADFSELRTVLENGITYCVKCHQQDIHGSKGT